MNGLGSIIASLAVWLVATTAWSAATLPPGVDWQRAASDTDIERVFAQAKAERKPILLYWGAAWCPPCNQLKATLFNRQDFAERMRSFVAVFVDGDGAGAQKLGSRFKVRGYPTLIVLNADAAELTRLPGEVDAPQVIALLQQGLAGGRPIKAVLADARVDKQLTSAEWRMLAFYSWDTDEAQLVPAVERPGLLAELSAKAPASEPEVGARLLLKALAGSDDGKGIKADDATRQRVSKLLADATATRKHMDVVTNGAADLARALAPQPGVARQRIVADLDSALRRLEANATLSRGDRLSALHGRVELARLGQPKDSRTPKMPSALLKELRAHVARDESEISDGYERQAVVTYAAYTLGQAGLWSDSDALLRRNLTKSHSPYYLMSQLASNARKLGRNDEALRWYEQAFDASEGPATRLQWGASYLSALVDLAPADAPRIEKAAAALFGEAGSQTNAFYERSAAALQRIGRKLEAWNKDGQQTAVLKRLKAQLDGVCGKLDVADLQRPTCEGLLKAPAGSA